MTKKPHAIGCNGKHSPMHRHDFRKGYAGAQRQTIEWHLIFAALESKRHSRILDMGKRSFAFPAEEMPEFIPNARQVRRMIFQMVLTYVGDGQYVMTRDKKLVRLQYSKEGDDTFNVQKTSKGRARKSNLDDYRVIKATKPKRKGKVVFI